MAVYLIAAEALCTVIYSIEVNWKMDMWNGHMAERMKGRICYSLTISYDLFNNEKKMVKYKFVSHESDLVGRGRISGKIAGNVWISMTNWSIKTVILIMSRNGTEFQKENITPKYTLKLLEQSIILCPNKGNYPIGFCFIKKQLVFIRMWVFMSIFICSFSKN